MPPVYSPLSWGALWRGFRAMTSRRAYEESLAECDDWMRRTYGPASWVWTDSGTTALTLALRLAAIETGSRRVALPAYGCFDLATACDGAESEVVLYDIVPETLGPDWESLKRALAHGARTVVMAHLYGMPTDIDRVRGLAHSFGAVLIEDAAQAIGASYRGRPCGAHGDLAVLSFGRGKGLPAGGGALLRHGSARSPLPKLPNPSLGLGAWLRGLAQFTFGRPELYGLAARLPFLGLGETRYRSPARVGAMPRSAVGSLTELSAAASEANQRRKDSALAWQSSILSSGPLTLPHCPGEGTPGFLRFPVLVPAERGGGQGLAANGVGPSYPCVLSDLPSVARRLVGVDREWPGAGALVDRLRTLPTGSVLSPVEMRAALRGLAGLTAA